MVAGDVPDRGKRNLKALFGRGLHGIAAHGSDRAVERGERIACLGGVFALGTGHVVFDDIDIAHLLQINRVAAGADGVILYGHTGDVIVSGRITACAVRKALACLGECGADQADSGGLVVGIDVLDIAAVGDLVVGYQDIGVVGLLVAVRNLGGGVALLREDTCPKAACCAADERIHGDRARRFGNAVAGDGDIFPVLALNGGALHVLKGVVGNGDAVKGQVEDLSV